VYTSEWVVKMAWWTPLLFGGTGVIALGAYPLIEHRLKTKLSAPAERTQLYIGLVSFMALYAASGFLHASNAVKLGVMLAGAIALFWMLGRSLGSVVIALIAAVMGSVVEATLIQAGAFASLDPDMFGVPMWLPGLYAAGALALGPLGGHMWSGRATAQPNPQLG
jgi:hypothetical protein